MGREHKYRGKDIETGKWVYGNLIHNDDALEGWTDIIIPINKSNIYTKGNSCNKSDLHIEKWYRVIPETVGKYTGLNDGKQNEEYPNGQEIYEDDAMSYHGYPYYSIIIIEWDNNRQRYNNWGNTYEPNNEWCEQHQVIGNIHDNIEFLEYK